MLGAGKNSAGMIEHDVDKTDKRTDKKRKIHWQNKRARCYL